MSVPALVWYLKFTGWVFEFLNGDPHGDASRYDQEAK